MKNLALYNPPSSFPQGSSRGFLVQTKLIPLTKGKSAIVDADDFDFLNKWRWNAHFSRGKYYAQRGKRIGNKQVVIHMHREILGTPVGKTVDHINGDSLDNRRSNLRSCSQAQNNINVSIRSNNKSGFKGVSQCGGGRWRAYIQVDKKWKHLGYFKEIKEAAKAYDAAAKQLHGEYARTNF